MKNYKHLYQISFIISLAFILFYTWQTGYTAPTAGKVPTKWKRSLPVRDCGIGEGNCQYSSPRLVDIDGDGRLDIVLATNKGYVLALSDDGTDNGHLIWQKDVAPAFGYSANTHYIHSTPAVADIDEDGFMEIAVGVGDTVRHGNLRGGVIVLEHTGQVKNNWPQKAKNDTGVPSVFSSPAIGDIDQDGDLEIFAGGLDKRIWGWQHNGDLVPGFPPDSVHLERFGWSNLQGTLADDIWSSPALADIDGDGFLDVIVTTGEGNYDDSFPGNANGWECPYRTIPGNPSGYCGGNVYVLDRFGQTLSGFPRWIHEIIQSSPIPYDTNGDGSFELIFGTGDWYHNQSPDHPAYGFNLLVWDRWGQNVPNWVDNNYGYGQSVSHVVNASPVVGDIAGNSEPEIVVMTRDGKLYAWHLDGNMVAGFPMTPLTVTGVSNEYGVGKSAILADYDGDKKMEIFIGQGWGITIVDGTGTQLTSSNHGNDNKPYYWMEGTILNNPAIGDIDNDGKPELVAFNQNIYVWDLPNQAQLEADWPQFKFDAAGTNHAVFPPQLEHISESITIWHDPEEMSQATAIVQLEKSGHGSLSGEIVSSPAGISLSANPFPIDEIGTYQLTLNVNVPRQYEAGWHTLGNITIDTWATHDPNNVTRHRIPVSLFVGEVQQSYFPMLTR